MNRDKQQAHQVKKLFVALSFVFISTYSMASSLEEVFNSVNAYSNTTAPKAIAGQTMNYYTGGSLFMRTSRKSYQLAAAAAPSWSSGCGGIDLFAGSFSYINKEQFVAMLRNIGANSLGFSFKLAMQNLCPTCDNVMQALEATARSINGMNINSCEMAEGLVNAAVPDTWRKSEANMAKTLGNATNQFSDALDAWKNVFSNETKARETTQRAAEKNPEIKEKLADGNVTWKALKKLPGLDDDTREIYMSMIGTVIFDSAKGQPQYLPSTDIDIKTLIGTPGQIKAELPVYRCTNKADCKQITLGTSKKYTALTKLVGDKLEKIAHHIANRSAYGADLNELIQFVNVTDIPVYKMVAVATSMNNRDAADFMIMRYQELIAARYAEIFIQRVAKDLRAALAQLSASVEATQAAAIKDMQIRLDALESNSRAVVQLATTQVMSTFSIAQEIQHMERALNNALSPSLQQSLMLSRTMGGR